MIAFNINRKYKWFIYEKIIVYDNCFIIEPKLNNPLDK